MGACFVCHPEGVSVPDDQLGEHMAEHHPEVWKEMQEAVWPDGAPIIVDETLEPSDFEERR